MKNSSSDVAALMREVVSRAWMGPFPLTTARENSMPMQIKTQ
jgi:hypothetical protein